MVGRWGDKADTRCTHASSRDPRVDLVRWKLSAFTRLGPLGHLDLNVVGVGEIHARDAKSPAGDLFDRASTFWIQQAFDGFTALSGIGTSAKPIHCDSQRLVHFLGDRTVGHCARRETTDDVIGRFDLIERHRVATADESEKSTECHQPLGLLIHRSRVVAENVISLLSCGVLQLEHGFGIEQVWRPLAAP
ncbi:unannotated protein [freshwater metagenome]|uniref:Unannotated protein n=1 Tax=freshwater metagenome TaxID=449393 RepID=A0A6J6B2U9_9ZZZZ